MPKYCAKCGKPVNGSEKICKDCSADRSESEAALFTRMAPGTEAWKTAEPVKKKKKTRIRLSPGGRRTRAFYIIAVIVAAIAALLILLSQPVPRVLRALKAEEIDRAMDIYWSSSALAESEGNPRIDKAVFALAEAICDRFANHELDADTAAEQLGKLGTFGPNAAEQLEEVYARFRGFNDSQDHMAAAERLFDDGSFLEARDEYLKIIEGDKNYEAARARIALCVTNYGESICEAAESAMAENDYPAALALLRDADDALFARETFSEAVDSKVLECLDRYRTYLLEEAERLAAQEQYAEAMALLEAALPDFSGEQPELNEALENYRVLDRDKMVTDAGKRADALYEEEKYDEAFAELDAAREEAGDSLETADALIEKLEKRFAAEMCAAADACFDGKRENLQAAVDLLDAALATRGLKEIEARRDELAQYLPLLLVKTEYSGKEGEVFRNDTVFESLNGTKFKNGWIWGADDASISFALDGSYDVFSCTFAMRRDDNVSANGHFEVFCDGERVYKSQKLYHFQKDEAEVSVEISGAKELKLVFICDYKVSTTENGYCYHGICDPVLTKDLPGAD